MDNADIFERIKNFRKNDLHISQEEFGKRLGVSRSVIKNMELNNLAKPEQKEPLIKLIVKEFNLNERWLRTGDGDPFCEILAEDEYVRATTEIDIKDPRARKIIIDYWHLTDTDKKLFMDFMERFVQKKQED